jgi:hypothetical protein
MNGTELRIIVNTQVDLLSTMDIGELLEEAGFTEEELGSLSGYGSTNVLAEDYIQACEAATPRVFVRPGPFDEADRFYHDIFASIQNYGPVEQVRHIEDWRKHMTDNCVSQKTNELYKRVF